MNKIFVKKYSLVITLAAVAVVMAGIKWQYRNVDWKETVALITPTVSPTSAPKLDERYPLWTLLPYTGKDFVVDRYTQPLTLAIKTNEIDLEAVKKEVWQWMAENKIATESHTLVFEKNE